MSAARRYAATQCASSAIGGSRPLVRGSSVSSTAGSLTCCSSCCSRCEVTPLPAASLAATRWRGCNLGGLGAIQLARVPAAKAAALKRPCCPLPKPSAIMLSNDRLCAPSICWRAVAGARAPALSRHKRGRMPRPFTQPGMARQKTCSSLCVAALTVYCSMPRPCPKPHTDGSTSTVDHGPTK